MCVCIGAQFHNIDYRLAATITGLVAQSQFTNWKGQLKCIIQPTVSTAESQRRLSELSVQRHQNKVQNVEWNVATYVGTFKYRQAWMDGEEEFQREFSQEVAEFIRFKMYIQLGAHLLATSIWSAGVTRFKIRYLDTRSIAET